MVAYNTGDLDNASRLHSEAIALGEQVGDRRLASVALTNLGLVALARQDFAAARLHLLRSLDLTEAVGERRAVAEILEELAGVDAAAGEMERAAVMFGAAQSLRAVIGAPVPQPDLARISDAVATVQAALGPERFSAMQARGAGLSPAEAITLAKTGPGPATAPETGPAAAPETSPAAAAGASPLAAETGQAAEAEPVSPAQPAQVAAAQADAAAAT
jgi:hypothetical protein